MSRYFMGDNRLGWLEKMMMSRPSPPRTAPRQKGPQRKPPCDQPTKPHSREWEIKEGGV